MIFFILSLSFREVTIHHAPKKVVSVKEIKVAQPNNWVMFE